MEVAVGWEGLWLGLGVVQELETAAAVAEVSPVQPVLGARRQGLVEVRETMVVDLAGAPPVVGPRAGARYLVA